MKWPEPLIWDGNGLLCAGHRIVPLTSLGRSAAEEYGQLVPMASYLIPPELNILGADSKVMGYLELPDHAGIIEISSGETIIPVMVAPPRLGGISFAHTLVDAIHTSERNEAWSAGAWARIGATSSNDVGNANTRFAVIRSYAEELTGAIIAIAANPRTALFKTRRIVPISAARTLDEEGFEIAFSGLEWERTPTEAKTRPLPKFFPEPCSEITLDVPANRWLAWLLRDIRQWIQSYRDFKELAELLNPLTDAIDLLSWIMREVTPATGLGSVHAVGADSRYRAVLESWLALQMGLESDPLETARMHSGTRALDKLYEAWATLTLLDQVAKLLDVPPNQRTKAFIGAWQRIVCVDETRNSPVELSGGGRKVEAWIQHQLYEPWVTQASPTGLYSTPRNAKPDLLLRIYIGEAEQKWAVYDAKMRITDDNYPPPAALDDLAFYREAIRKAENGDRVVLRAHALFPGTKRLHSHRFDQSRTYGVGAVPLTPGFLTELTQELKDLMAI